MLRAFVLFALFGFVVCDFEDVFEECFKKDSISCIQMKVFNNARDLLSQESIDFVGGVSLVKNKKVGKSVDLENLEEYVANASDARSRQVAIEKYLVRKARDVMVTRTIQWNVGETVRALANSLPQDFKNKITSLVTEGRGKRKKLMRLLMPILIALKLKLAIVSIISFLAIALMAKKALLAGFISLVISGYLGIKKLLNNSGSSKVHEESYHASPVWNPSSGYSGWSGYDGHGDFGSSGHGHNLAYSGHKSP